MWCFVGDDCVSSARIVFRSGTPLWGMSKVMMICPFLLAQTKEICAGPERPGMGASIGTSLVSSIRSATNCAGVVSAAPESSKSYEYSSTRSPKVETPSVIDAMVSALPLLKGRAFSVDAAPLTWSIVASPRAGSREANLATTLWPRARPAAREAHAKTTPDNTMFIDGFLQRREGPVRHKSLFLQRTPAIRLQNLPEHSDTPG